MRLQVKSLQIVKTLNVTVNCYKYNKSKSSPKYYRINNKCLGTSTRTEFAVKFC